MSAPDPTAGEPGLEARFYVRKMNDPTGKHAECRYFVLDPQHDPVAREALVEYARRTPHKALRRDLWDWLESSPATPDADDASEREHADGCATEHTWSEDDCTCREPLTEAERETMTALRREIGPPTNHDHRWQPMVAASEVRALLDCIDRLVREAAAATKARAEGAALVRDDIRARRREFKRLGADEQYLSALDDAFGLAANRARGDA